MRQFISQSERIRPSALQRTRDQLIGVRSRAISRKLRSVQSLDEASASALLEIDDMNELPKALSETSETSGKVGEY